MSVWLVKEGGVICMLTHISVDITGNVHGMWAQMCDSSVR